MKISFVIPAYNREKLIFETIDSIILAVNQSPDLEFEIVVIDDASTDNTEAVVKSRYKNLIESELLIYERLQNNVGVTGAKNKGTELSSGEWIVFIDSDDLMESAKFNLVIDVLKEKQNYSLVFFSCEYFDGRRVGPCFESYELTLDKYIKRGTLGEKLPVIKREVAIQFPYEEKLRGFESIVYYKLLLSNKRIWMSNVIARKYRTDNNDRLSTKFGIFNRAKFLSEGNKILVDCFEEKHISPPVSLWVKRYIYFAIYIIGLKWLHGRI